VISRSSILTASWLAFGSLVGLLSLTACTGKKQDVPVIVPAADKDGKVEKSSEAPAPNSFKVTAETFADVRILRYQVPGFERLTKQQKLALYYMQQAALSGRDITFDQRYEHNLLIKRALEAVVRTPGMDKTTKPYGALLAYLKRVWFANGIHHHYSSKKMLPEGINADEFAALLRKADPALLPLSPGQSKDALVAQIVPLLFDPNIAKKGVNKDPAQDPVTTSAAHFYVGLTKEDVERYVKERTVSDDPTPVSIGLNSQLVKSGASFEERTWRVGGMYGSALAECVTWLQKAAEVAETSAQRDALARLITFYRTGSLEDWDRYSVAWVEDTASKLDLIHGFIETYGDPMGLRGTYEALVQLEDEQATKRMRTLSGQAQWFEDQSPIDPQYRKPNVVGVSARVVEAVLGAGATSPTMPGGINLPNAAWIRQQHGSKSITIGNVLAAVDEAERGNGVLEEFASGAREMERARENGSAARALLVDLHEVIGHASGRLAPGVGSENETLRQYASAIEEARADLVALYYLLDPKLVTLKLMPSLDTGRAAYDAFVRNALLVQLARVNRGDTLEEAHMRARHMIAHWAFETGAQDGVIEKISRGGKTYFAVRDYVKLRKLFGKLLSDVQRIKSQGDFESARELVEAHGVKIDSELHKEVLTRYAVLGVAPYTGFIQPELVPVMKEGEIVDVKIEYPEDFAAQQLRYSERFSFLPVVN
jgi:dipeptidyl-peptidase-3